ncbi:MAG TPA: phosphoribosylglycinamide formyltransferase [Thermoanaerobaculia bacterium]
MTRRRLAILLSGRGSNFEAICQATEQGRLPGAQIVAVISDVADAAGLARAAARGLPAFPLPRSDFASRREHERAILRVLDAANVDLVCLAGYMRLLSPDFVAAYRGRILNIHPSLLPLYPGLHPQRQALDAGAVVSGCTVHLVDEGTDTGPVILQKQVPVLEGDTEESLSARILTVEHEAYPEAIALVLSRLPKTP